MYILPENTFVAPVSSVPLTPREALSGIFGVISITCWVVFLTPQLLENYRNQSAEALSLIFVLIWFAGDLTNLFGGLWAGQIPTAIAQAVWFVIMDLILTAQALYYSIRNRRREGRTWLQAARASVSGISNTEAAEAVARVRREQLERAQQQQNQEEDDEEQPLLKRTISGSANRNTNDASTFSSSTQTYTSTATTTKSMSPAQRRSSINEEMIQQRRRSNSASHLVKALEEHDPYTGVRFIFKNILGLLGTYLLGAVAWFIAYKTGTWKPVPLDEGPSKPIAGGAQVLGYASSILYLGARIPQIIKNYREKSCEGLSLLFFMLSISGNITYGIGILCHSTERHYFLTNLPWLIGSLGTVFQDVMIFAQFWIYGSKVDESAIE